MTKAISKKTTGALVGAAIGGGAAYMLRPKTGANANSMTYPLIGLAAGAVLGYFLLKKVF